MEPSSVNSAVPVVSIKTQDGQVRTFEFIMPYPAYDDSIRVGNIRNVHDVDLSGQIRIDTLLDVCLSHSQDDT
eukprot:CFRG6372T1